MAVEDWELQPAFHHRGLHIEHHGYAWMICNSDGMNVARKRGGTTLIGDEELARAVLTYLGGDDAK